MGVEAAGRRQGLEGSPGTMKISGAILAGGGSRRLGRDKAALQLGGKALVHWVAAALAPVVSETWLITNHPLAHVAFALPLVIDLYPFQGPAGGLATALFYARNPWVLAAAVDNPFPAADLLAELKVQAAATSRLAVVCQSASGLEPFPGLYSVRLLPRLARFLRSDRRPTRFLEICQSLVIPLETVQRLDPEGCSFFNLNTAAEVARAQAWLQEKCLPGGPFVSS